MFAKVVLFINTRTHGQQHLQLFTKAALLCDTTALSAAAHCKSGLPRDILFIEVSQAQLLAKFETAVCELDELKTNSRTHILCSAAHDLCSVYNVKMGISQNTESDDSLGATPAASPRVQ